MMLVLLLACGGSKVAYAVNLMSLIPDQKGVSGTQTWQFFNSDWANDRSAKNYVCGRTQDITGTVVAPPASCTSCDNAYMLTATEIDTDCEGDEAKEAGYATTLYIAIGEVSSDISDMNPYPDDAMGWYLPTNGEDYEAWGFASDEQLDFPDGTPGPSLWTSDRVYTLKPAVALEL